MTRQLSPIDLIYAAVTGGEAPAKAGVAYERLSAAVVSLLCGADAAHDLHVSGLSGVDHQLDGVTAANDVIEAKDHLLQDGKVGLGEVQEMQGVLTDLDDMKRGIYTSATGFTKPAEKYAAATAQNPRQTPILPMTIRPVVEKDREGRVQTIKIQFVIVNPEYDKAQCGVMLPDGEEFPDGPVRVSEFYDSQGNVISTINKLVDSHPLDLAVIKEDTWLDQTLELDSYIKAGDRYIHILGLKLRVPISVDREDLVITPNGNPQLLAACGPLSVNKLITDTDLRAALSRLK